MLQMVFELINGALFPRLPRTPTGEAIVPDGARYFTLEQAAQHAGRSLESLTDEWTSVWGGYVDCRGEPEAAGVDPVTVALKRATDDVLRIVRFSHLDDQQWEHVQEECRRRRIDPRQVWVRLEHNDDTGKPEPMLITTLSVVRQVAERTGQRGTETLPKWCGADGKWKDLWNSEHGRPYAACAAVTRRAPNGVEKVHEAIVYWKLHAQYVPDGRGGVKLDEFWDKGDAHMLGKCAIVAAYRNGWALELEGIYTCDEITVRDAKPGIKETEPAPASAPEQPGTPAAPPVAALLDLQDDPKSAAALVNDGICDSDSWLVVQLMELGLDDPARRAVLALFKSKLPKLYAHYRLGWIASVLKAVCTNPTAYGAAPVATA